MNIRCDHCGRSFDSTKLVQGNLMVVICPDCRGAGHPIYKNCSKCVIHNPTNSWMDHLTAEDINQIVLGNKKDIPKTAEGMICPHCNVYFEVEGDIKTWDVVYLTCQVCFAKGHRRMPAKCDVCTKDLTGFAKELAQEVLKETEKAEKRDEGIGRNIVL